MTSNFPYIIPSAKLGSEMLFGDIHIGHRWARHNLAIALSFKAFFNNVFSLIKDLSCMAIDTINVCDMV